MALIICPECGKEYSDKAPACPNCGCPTQTDDNVYTEPQKVEISKIAVSKKWKTAFIILISLILIGAAVFTVMHFSNEARLRQEAEQALQDAENARQAYNSNLSSARFMMITGAITAESTAGLIHDVWANTINKTSDTKTDKYTKNYGWFNDDFNVSLNNLISSSEYKSDVNAIKRNQDSVADIMKKLMAPPDEYKEAYNAIRDLHSAYMDLCNCATNPSGNLNSYTTKFNNADSDFMKYYNAMDIYLDK